MITPDGKWAVLAQCKGTWAEPNFLVRVDLATGKSFTLDIPEADKIKPLTYVAAHGGVLVVRFQERQHSYGRKSVGPEIPEYWLVDASTGKAEPVHGGGWLRPVIRRPIIKCANSKKPGHEHIRISQSSGASLYIKR